MAATLLDVDAVRARYSSLRGGGFAFLDAPGGSQVPDEVGEAIACALREASGNLGAPYETGRRVEEILERARADAGRFLGCSADDVVFGANMTTLDFALSRTASRDWREGDRILVSRLDHDGGVAPWIELAADRGFEVDWIDVGDDLRLDLADLERKLDERVRVVACVAASNAVGTITDVARVAELAHAAGALCWVDAVHFAAHEPVDVQALGVDVLLCSPYKFCGPHLGLAYGRHELLDSWRAYKARPAGSTPVGRKFETGTAPYELLAGFSATISYLESLGGVAVLREYERTLGARFLETLPAGVTVYGPPAMDGRVPTFLINVEGIEAAEVAARMAERGYGVWAHDSWYSLGLREKLPYPREAVRVGFIHYNTVAEVDGFVRELGLLAA
jgi:cysteine desulfurase family protein (TIGR01976 family)